MEFFLFMPQMRLSFGDLVARATAAEAAGFVGMTGMDHLAPPMAEDQPMYEAIVTNTWLAAHTKRLKVGSLVLCDAFRLPALLARQAVSIDHASGGRYELGLGWGSMPDEFGSFGVGSPEPRHRVQRLRETLEVIRALWSGEVVDYEGEFHRLRGARQKPLPLGRIPIVIGGFGPKTLRLVRDFADWWNLNAIAVPNLQRLRDQVGAARVSVQEILAIVPAGRESERGRITELATKRFGHYKPVVGSGPELLDHYGRLADQGVERVYTWFCDFAPPETLAAFGAEVVAPLGTHP